MSRLDDLQHEVRALRAELTRSRRQTRLGLAAMALGASVLVLAGADEPSKILRADRIEIGDEAIVLSEGPEGPSITLSAGDDRTTRLSMAGLELTTTAAEPRELPTLDDPGLGEEEPSAKRRGRPVTIELEKGIRASHFEVSCKNGFRERARFSSGRAVMGVPSDGQECVATFGGGLTAIRLLVHPGDDLMCGRVGAGGPLVCRPQVTAHRE